MCRVCKNASPQVEAKRPSTKKNIAPKEEVEARRNRMQKMYAPSQFVNSFYHMNAKLPVHLCNHLFLIPCRNQNEKTQSLHRLPPCRQYNHQEKLKSY